MNTQNTLRCNAMLVIYNGYGSSFGTFFKKGDKISDVMDSLKSIRHSHDDLRARPTYAKLISDKTDRVLREWSSREIAAMA